MMLKLISNPHSVGYSTCIFLINIQGNSVPTTIVPTCSTTHLPPGHLNCPKVYLPQIRSIEFSTVSKWWLNPKKMKNIPTRVFPLIWNTRKSLSTTMKFWNTSDNWVRTSYVLYSSWWCPASSSAWSSCVTLSLPAFLNIGKSPILCLFLNHLMKHRNQ